MVTICYFSRLTLNQGIGNQVKMAWNIQQEPIQAKKSSIFAKLKSKKP